MHDERRRSGRVQVVQRRLGGTVAARVARVEQVLSVGAAARVAAILRVVASTPVRVRRMSTVLGRQQARSCSHWNLDHALALQHVVHCNTPTRQPLNFIEFHFFPFRSIVSAQYPTRVGSVRCCRIQSTKASTDRRTLTLPTFCHSRQTVTSGLRCQSVERIAPRQPTSHSHCHSRSSGSVSNMFVFLFRRSYDTIR